MLDDAGLLRRYAAQRAEEAFAEIVRRHLDAVYSAALRRVGGDVHIAEDVTQQVFIALARKAAVVSHHPVLTAWLHLATHHEAANAVRAERRRKSREQAAQAMRENLPEPEVDWANLAPLLDAAIDELNDSDRAAILLRYMDRQSFPEIGAALRLSEDAARMRVDRALEKLRRLLAARGITSTAAALGLAMTSRLVAGAPAGLGAAVTGAAVATIPAATLSLVSVVELMSTTKAVAGAVGLAVAAAVGVSTREVSSLQANQATFATSQQENDAAAAKLRELDRRTTAVAREAADLQRLLDAGAAHQRESAKAGPAAAAANQNASSVSPAAVAAGEAFMQRHPEVKAALYDYLQTQFATMFAPLYRAYNFTPAQIQQFEHFMMMDSGVIRRLTGPDGEQLILAGPDFGHREKRREFEKTLRWMGPDGSKFARECMGARRLTTQLAGALFFTKTPLTTEQMQKLSARTSTEPGPRASWESIFGAASGVLSEPQLAMLHGYVEQDRHRAVLNAATSGASSRHP